MKSHDFGLVLKAFSDVLAVAHAVDASNQMKRLAVLFDLSASTPVTAVMNRLATVPFKGTTGSPSLGDAARILSSLGEFVAKVGKASAVSDIESVARFLRSDPSIELDSFVIAASEAMRAPPLKKGANTSIRRASSASRPRRAQMPLREDLVSNYCSKLTSSLGDKERFETIYNNLTNDPSISKNELVELARQVTGTSAKSKAEALKKIWNRHQSLLMFKAKSNATGGRSAA